MTFADRMREARLAANAMQKQVARACGVTVAAVSGWENGYSKGLKMRHLFAAARFLHCDPEWLATGRKPPKTGIPSMPLDEKEWLALYRSLPAPKRKLLLKALTALSEK